MLTAESFVDFNAEKAKLYVELAEQVKGINQMHLVRVTFRHQIDYSYELDRAQISPIDVPAIVASG